MTDEHLSNEQEATGEVARSSEPRPIRQPAGIDVFEASGTDVEELKQRLFKDSKGRELFYQELEGEDGQVTVYGYIRTQVLDMIYEKAYPIIKIIDDRAAIKVKSNRAVTEFFVIVQTRRGGAFIGQHGQTLDALETLVSHTVSRNFPRWLSICVDADKYRQKRQSFLEGLIKKVVREIERDHRERPMKGLLPKERKFVHQYFSGHPYLTTESRGKRAERVLYILPRKDIQEV